MLTTRLFALAALAIAAPAFAQQDGTVTQAGAARDSSAVAADTQPTKAKG